MLKMAIEGDENEVLFDCTDELNLCDNIFVEYHSIASKGQKLHDILELFSNMGFRYHIQEAFVRKRPFVDKDLMLGMDLQLNLYFWKINR